MKHELGGSQPGIILLDCLQVGRWSERSAHGNPDLVAGVVLRRCDTLTGRVDILLGLKRHILEKSAASFASMASPSLASVSAAHWSFRGLWPPGVCQGWYPGEPARPSVFPLRARVLHFFDVV